MEGLFAFLDTGLWLLLAIRANCSLHVAQPAPPSTLEEPPPWVPLQSNSFWVQPITHEDQGRSRKQTQRPPRPAGKMAQGQGCAQVTTGLPAFAFGFFSW